MKSNEINNNLEDFFNKSQYRSILIDGPWGCGKTFEVQKFIVKHKKECAYVSLFGLETLDEINTEIFKQCNPKLAKVVAVSSVVSKAISAVPYVGGIDSALSYVLGNYDQNKIKKSKIIILDDLERLSIKIEYKDLVGYINRLFMGEVRIVCLVSLQNFGGDERRKNDFLEFREKVFDSCLTISNVAEDVYDEMFSKLGIEDGHLLYPLFENNIRTAKRAILFYEDVVNEINTRNIQLKRIKKYDLLKACILTVLCVLGRNYDKPKTENNYLKMYYEDQAALYGENITNGLFKYFSASKQDEDHLYIKTLVESLIMFFLFRRFDEVYQMINREERIETDNILVKQPFYLSDKDKKIYFDKVEEFILEKKDWSSLFKTYVRNIYLETNYELSEIVIKKLAELDALKTFTLKYSKNMEVYSFYFAGTMEPNESIINFCDIYFDTYFKVFIEKINKLINEYIKTHEYTKLSDMLNRNDLASMFKNKEFLVKHNFFIPDLSGEIDEAEWSFCHTVASLCEKSNISEEYIKAVKDIYKKSDNKTYSLKTRLWALIHYRIDSSFKIEDLEKN